MRWMILELIMQSEVSQKEKDLYHILTHKYGIYKNGIEEFTYMATMEKKFYLLIWLHQVLAVAHRIFHLHCSVWDLVP